MNELVDIKIEEKNGIYVDSKGIQQTSHLSVWSEKRRRFIHDLVEDL